MADASAADESVVTFHVKSSNDKKHTVSVPLSHTVLQLKEKLSDTSYAGIPPERQRLIYSGRVLKDPDTLATYKIKEGNTVHLVKGAESNQRQNPANAGPITIPGAGVPGAVPSNLSAGSGVNNPLAGLTGARYAGLAHLPSQSLFGPDGGMGPPPDPEQIIHMLENPQFASTINEALSNPQIIETMINQNPMLRDMGPEMRQMMQTPEFRRMMTDPAMLRQTMQMQRAMGGGPFGRMGGGAGGNGAFPAPGATDTMPAGANASDGSQGAQSPGQGQQGGQQQQQQQQQQANPFAMFGGMGGGGGAAGGQANPFASLFNPGGFGASQGQGQGQQGGENGSGQQQGGQQQGMNPLASNPLLQNPQLMQQFMQAMNPQAQQQQQQPAQNPAQPGSADTPSSTAATAADGTTLTTTTGAADSTTTSASAQNPPGNNPFAAMLSSALSQYGQPNPDGSRAAPPAIDPAALESMFGPNGLFGGARGAGAGAGAGGWPGAGGLGAFGQQGGWGGAGAGSPPPPPPPADTRPPEERFADQLRQLNDMGFYDFDRNIAALRRSGGSVQGAVEHLLG